MTLFGCSFSFQSNQYSAIKGLLDREVNKGPQSNWLLTWSGYQIPMMAVLVENETWFMAPKDVLVRFDGWQITEVNNLLPANTSVRIQFADKEMVIFEGRRNISSFTCKEWQKHKYELGINHLQSCSRGNLVFDNSIWVNNNGSISKMAFKVHPNYPEVTLELLNQYSLN